MSTVEAKRRARAAWRIRRRQQGWSWRCILGIHEACSALVGRLGQPRRPCACRCHTEPDPE